MAWHNLKGCPFCGGMPYIESHMRVFINGKSAKAALVWCKDCKARTEKIPIEPIGEAEAVQRAINRWNSRFNSQVYMSVNDHR